MMILWKQIQIMMQIFRRRKSKETFTISSISTLEHPSPLSTSSSNTVRNSSSQRVRKSKVRTLSVPKTYPKSKRSITFNFNLTPAAPDPVSPIPVATPTAPSKPLFNRQALQRAKTQKMNRTRKEKDMSTNFLLGLLDSLPLPDHYKTNHLLNHLADLPPTDLPTVVEPVSLNAVSVQTTCMPSADVLSWHPDDPDPVPAYKNRECRVKQIRIDTSNFTSDLYSEFDNDQYSLVFDDDDIPLYDLPTKVNLLDVGTMNDYWSHDPENITVNAVKIVKDDPTAIRGQFDSGAGTTVTNLLIYLHN